MIFLEIVMNIIGTKGNDVLIGLDEGRWLVGLLGDDTLNGGGGDVLTNIETLQFSNTKIETSWFTDAGNLASNPATADAFDTLNGMYMAYFNRAPDSAGLYQTRAAQMMRRTLQPRVKWATIFR
jgi:Ca2+-binding RTX toxin-like protein